MPASIWHVQQAMKPAWLTRNVWVLSLVSLLLFMVERTELAMVLVMDYASPRVRVLSISSLLADMTSTLAW